MTARGKRILLGVAGVLGTLAVAELTLVVLRVNPLYVPHVTTIVRRIVEILGDPAFVGQVIDTVIAWLEGLAIATVVGTVLGIIFAEVRVIRTSLRGVIDFIRPVPSVALVPLGIVALGMGDSLRLALIVYAATWPVMFNVMNGIRQLDSAQLETARVFQIPKLMRFRYIVLNSVLAPFSTGVRIAAPLALILAISTEMLGGSFTGLGVWILQVSEGAGRNDLVFAGTFIAGVLGVCANSLIVLLQRVLLPWHPMVRSMMERQK